jgi:RNA polymerase sigma factor (sigma-70 family)
MTSTTGTEAPARSAERQTRPGDGGRADPYRWGRIVAAKTVRQCAVPGQARNRDDEEEVGSLSSLVVTNCLRYYDPTKGALSTYIARAVIRATVRWVKYEYRYRTFTCPLDTTPGTRPAAHVDDEEPGGWESCIEASAEDDYNLGEAETLIAVLFAALDQIPAKERRVVTAYYWRGQSLRELAPEVGVSFESVRRYLHRGEGRLVELLEGTNL